MPKKLVKPKSKKTLKNELWKVFSIYIRKRDTGSCITCDKKGDYKEFDAGHYIPKTKGLSIYFDERNVNKQCNPCNRWKHGNLTVYALAMTRKYGQGILEELDALSNTTRKISTQEYVDLINYYKSKI